MWLKTVESQRHSCPHIPTTMSGIKLLARQVEPHSQPLGISLTGKVDTLCFPEVLLLMWRYLPCCHHLSSLNLPVLKKSYWRYFSSLFILLHYLYNCSVCIAQRGLETTFCHAAQCWAGAGTFCWFIATYNIQLLCSHLGECMAHHMALAAEKKMQNRYFGCTQAGYSAAVHLLLSHG